MADVSECCCDRRWSPNLLNQVEIGKFKAIFFGTLVIFVHVVMGQQGSNSTTTTVAPVIVASKDCNSSGPGYRTPRNVTASGTDLWCYECSEIYKAEYDPNDSPCLNNLSQITIRQCSPADKYCKIERLKLADQVMSMERGCSNRCPFGCRYNGYGLQYERCYSCCNTYGCNDGNGSERTVCISNLASGLISLLAVAMRKAALKT